MWHGTSGAERDRDVQHRITALLAEVGGHPARGSGIVPVSPGAPGSAADIAADGRTARAEVPFDAPRTDLTKDDVQPIVDTVAATRTDRLDTAAGGAMIEVTEQPAAGLSEAVGLADAAVIQLLVFGSMPAMTLPIITAVGALGAGLSVVVLQSHLYPITDTTRRWVRWSVPVWGSTTRRSSPTDTGPRCASGTAPSTPSRTHSNLRARRAARG
ncbi:MMPL family transporter [Nocardia araoensis]|uniref:MMPL family transporter n=1 Tax=Nocardia araoensis TaxID=228600 RepID=UPI000683DDB0|nr:MMPL family transporter [Nocardia araoensis]